MLYVCMQIGSGVIADTLGARILVIGARCLRETYFRNISLDNRINGYPG